VLGCGVVCPSGGRGTLLGRAGLFAVAGRAVLALFGRAGLLVATGRVAGTFTGAFFAATTPAPLNAPGLAVAAIGGRPWFSEANSVRSRLAASRC
jgi:hypothetical protein